ncbi:MAG: Gfo/Idh/MocA family oxidoreductase [Rhodobacteraceae bacterium]|nr:Gfo/Idh/MocA family oxidoreductase [Paracoccaceae bacterium]
MTRLLVAGGGLIGRRHIAFAVDHPGIDLVGVIDPNPDVRALFPVPGFADLHDVDVAADGIIIATPTDMHADHAEIAADHGWHMLIEKPIAGSVEQADRIIRAADRGGVHVLVGHHRRYHPQVQKLKALLDEGRIGTPVLASMIWSMKKPDDYFDVPWRSGREGSPIMINLVHEVDLLRFLFGDPVHVSGFGSSQLRDQNRIESGAVTLGFAGGLVASVVFADTTLSPWGFEAGIGENPNIGSTGQDMLKIMGTEGAIDFPSLTLWSGADDWSQAAQSSVIPCKTGVPLTAQIEHFCDVIAGRATPLINARDARQTLLTTLAIESALGVT